MRSIAVAAIGLMPFRDVPTIRYYQQVQHSHELPMTGGLSTIRDPELREALSRLFGRQTFGIKLGLGPTLDLLAEFGSPHENLAVIHVAGTNGKGSVCAMIASVLREAGLRVGLYASPHLVDFRERMRINGEMIPEERLAHYAREMMPAIERIGCTFFEGTTAMAFRYFADESVDVVVLETGMGGRLDSTNVVTPLVSVITSIGLDHTRHLGETYEEIAREKGGIIKPNVPVVIGRVRPRLLDLFKEMASSLNAPLRSVDDYCRAVALGTDLEGARASFMLGERELENLFIGLAGPHQIENACVALTALGLIAERFGLNDEIVRRGLAAVRTNSGIAGRFELIRRNPDIVLDVAHNADGAAVLAGTLKRALPTDDGLHVIYGAVRDKDIGAVLEQVRPFIRHLYAVSANNPRSLPSDEIAHRSRSLEIPTTDSGSVADGIRDALAACEKGGRILVFGSFFVVGEALEALRIRDASDDMEGDGEKVGGNTYHYPFATSDSPVRSDDSITTRDITTMNASPKKEAESSYEYVAPSDGHRSVKDWHPGEQPRERLLRNGADTLSEAELIAILLRTGTQGKDVVRVSRDLLHMFGDGKVGDGLLDLSGRDPKELEAIGGIGPGKAAILAAAFELGRRVASRTFDERPRVTGPKDIARLFVSRMRGLRKEQFHVVLLSAAGQVIRTELVSEGSLTCSIVHPREVFRKAVIESAASVIGVHNHPSGNLEPSTEDISITRQLVEAGRILNIPFHDHIIIAGESHLSLMESGLV